MKRIVWLFFEKKSFISSNGLLKSKIWIGYLTKTSKMEKYYIDSHSKFVIEIQYIM
jgi:hypothetical protein